MTNSKEHARIAAADELLASARRTSGIDQDDRAAREPLERLVDSLNREGQLHARGADAMHSRLIRILSNRLRMQRDLIAHPEIARQAITAPVFVCGMARTGSTKTQKLLAASGDFNWLPYWQVLNPSLRTGQCDESPAERIADTEEFVRYFDSMSPQTRAGHAFATHEPEEESFILEHSLRTPTFMGWAPLSSYLDWLLTQNLAAQFLYLRATLQYLQWQGLASAGKPWVLKCPLYSGLEPLLLAVFPDARLVMTHRHPEVTIPSGLRLLECFYKPFSNAVPDAAYFLAGQSAAIAGHLQFRAGAPPNTFLDVSFGELMSNLRPTMQRLYDFVGKPLSAESFQRMQAWEAANPQFKHGKHEYSLERFGLTREIVARQFEGYIALVNALPVSANR